MSHFSPVGFESIDPISEQPWHEPLDDLPDLEAMGVDLSTHKNVYQRGVTDFSLAEGTQTVASPGFTRCAAVIVRNNNTGQHTFGHLQPGVLSFEEHMEGRRVDDGDAVVVLGEVSQPPDAMWDLRAGKWGDINTRVISFESGSTWWAAVFDAASGEITIASRKPTPKLTTYSALKSILDHSG